MATYLHSWERWLMKSRFREWSMKFDPLVLHVTPPTRGWLLDVATGAGVGLVWLSEHVDKGEVVGLDIDPDLLKVAQERVSRRGFGSKNHLICADATRLPLKDSIFDFVSIIGALHHMPNAQVAVKEACRVLKEGGVFATEDFQRGLFGALERHAIEKHGYNIRFWTRDELKNIVKNSGFKEIKEFLERHLGFVFCVVLLAKK